MITNHPKLTVGCGLEIHLPKYPVYPPISALSPLCAKNKGLISGWPGGFVAFCKVLCPLQAHKKVLHCLSQPYHFWKAAECCC